MLADSAQVQGGKLFVLGGGFDTITTRSLPVVHRSLAVALVAVVSPEERHRDLVITVNLVGEDDESIGVEAKGRLRVGAPPNLPPESSSVVPIVTPFYNVRFKEAQKYGFVVGFEGEELARVAFRVMLVSS